MPPVAEQPVLLSLLGAGFAAAFLHAALPTHWLPFVLVGRAQRWRLGRLLLVTAAAATAHIASTALVGGLMVVAGLALDELVAGLLPHLSAALLFVFGGFYLAKGLLRRSAMAGGPEVAAPEPNVSDAAAVGGLVAMMALSPGEVLLPIYLSSAQEGLTALVALTAAFLAGTLLGMALFTTLAKAGASVLRLERWARYESLVLGLGLIALALLVLTHQH
jgi:uncharacterized membrane protein